MSNNRNETQPGSDAQTENQQMAEIKQALIEVDAADFASDEDVNKVFRKYSKNI